MLEALALLFALVAYKAYDAGEFKAIPSINEDHVRHMRGMEGLEDLQIVGDYLFASRDDRSWLRLVGVNVDVDKRLRDVANGAIIRIPLSDIASYLASGSDDPFQLTQDMEVRMDGFHGIFHPHGFNIRKSAVGNSYVLAVLNNRPRERAVEFFDLGELAPGSENAMVHRYSLRNEHIHWLNDLILMSDTSFYATNWLFSNPGTLASAYETLAKQPKGFTLFCEHSYDQSPATCKVVASGQRMPNGIAQLPDGTIAVVETLSKSIIIHEIEESTHDLIAVKEIATDSACDNLSVHRDGDLIVACHPKALTFTAHAVYHTTSPTQVLKISPHLGTVDMIFSSYSPAFSAGSGAVILYADQIRAALSASDAERDAVSGRDYMLIGSVHDDGILITDAPVSV